MKLYAASRLYEPAELEAYYVQGLDCWCLHYYCPPFRWNASDDNAVLQEGRIKFCGLMRYASCSTHLDVSGVCQDRKGGGQEIVFRDLRVRVKEN